jgi:hypothetical protein
MIGRDGGQHPLGCCTAERGVRADKTILRRARKASEQDDLGGTSNRPYPATGTPGNGICTVCESLFLGLSSIHSIKCYVGTQSRQDDFGVHIISSLEPLGEIGMRWARPELELPIRQKRSDAPVIDVTSGKSRYVKIRKIIG